MPKGTTIPKGRINMPRPAKTKAKETVLVFAEGRQADEARRAGADIVGGPELVDGVSHFLTQLKLTGIHDATLGD